MKQKLPVQVWGLKSDSGDDPSSDPDDESDTDSSDDGMHLEKVNLLNNTIVSRIILSC